MKINRRQLRNLIKEELANSIHVNEGYDDIDTEDSKLEMDEKRPQELLLAMLLPLQLASPVPFTPRALKMKVAQNAAYQTGFLIGGETLAASMSAAMAGTALFAAVAGTFLLLPTMIKFQIEQLDTVEGFLKNLRLTLGKPISPKDIVRHRWPSSRFTEQDWDGWDMVDYVAAYMETERGRNLYTRLIGGEFQHNFLRRRGPIIDQGFANAIQRRRKTLKKDAKENIDKEVMDKAKELASDNTPESLEKLYDYTKFMYDMYGKANPTGKVTLDIVADEIKNYKLV